MANKLIIKPRAKGDDGYRTFSVRIKEQTVERLDRLAAETNRTRNEIVNILLDYALENSEVSDNK